MELNFENIPACLRVIAREIEDGKIGADVGLLTLRKNGSDHPSVFGFGPVNGIDPYGECTRAAIELDRLTGAGQPPARMDFGEALYSLKNGIRVMREGWNGKGMFLQLTQPEDYKVRAPDDVALLAPDVDLAPWIGMKTADNKFVPWLASQTDMLAEDWVLAK